LDKHGVNLLVWDVPDMRARGRDVKVFGMVLNWRGLGDRFEALFAHLAGNYGDGHR